MQIDLASLTSLEIYTGMTQSIVPRPSVWKLIENESASAEGRVTIDTMMLDSIGRFGGGEYIPAREVTYIEHPA